MIYDVSNPRAPEFVTYFNNRDFSVGDVENGPVGDLGPEDIRFVPKTDSPNGDALLIVANEVSGTVSIFTFGDVPTNVEDVFAAELPWRIFPNPVQEVIFTNVTADFAVYNQMGQQMLSVRNTNYLRVNQLPAGTYVIRNLSSGQSQLFMKQ